ncbi:MAG: hypothetical protein HRT72_12730, partial [Flavobacteriales bacterium]|nr:hypothetical protein [Flavobacteriales bacterium]
MKKKIILISGVLISIAVIVYYLAILRDSYPISTTGVLYVVNKGGSTISVFDLAKGKLIKELIIEI